VATQPNQPEPRRRTRAVSSADVLDVKSRRPDLAGAVVAEVVDHPLVELLRQVNPVHNQFDLWELTQLSLEVHGSAYWLVDFEPVMQRPARIWPLPAHQVTPQRAANSSRLVDAYEFRGHGTHVFSPDRIVHFRFPDPRDPYCSGLGPLRACFEQVTLLSDYTSMKRGIYDNTGLPSVLLTPSDALGADERDRLEKMWQQKFTGAGRGRALVAESALNVTVLSQSMGDLAALADMKATKEDIANAFHVPLPFLTGETNLANLQAADHLHKTLAITPRLRRRDEKLNEQLIPLYDGSGRLFFHTPDPTPANQQYVLQQEQADVRLGIRTINEVRATRGLPPVPWGDRSLPD
jgi:HK97 family phage portal protein